MELEITFGRLMRVWWAWFWRNVLILIFGLLPVSLVLGLIVGFLMGLAGVQPGVGRWISMGLGMLVGAVASIIPIWLILGERYGNFRLVLVAAEGEDRAPADAAIESATVSEAE